MQRFIPAEERGWDELLYWLIFPLFPLFLYSVQQVAICAIAIASRGSSNSFCVYRN
ncbi:hypothetical protein [Allocoleopsis sp.]|uniref:hypothetical protein n=1 Tax=Allocoleopsis sp. TaxID=3088169 RepID=UPI002FD50412